jgi:glycosyltransferase involved in cell wall biosynthesis
MASEVPVISTGVGGIKDLLGNYLVSYKNSTGFKVCERGIVCPINDPKMLADGLKYILDNNFLQNTNIVKQAKEYVLTNYSDKRLIDEMQNLYFNLITTK